MRTVDVLILGQGLAGSFLSFWLIHFGAEIAVIDTPQWFPASAVGTGTFNPIAGYRFTPFWHFEDCRDALLESTAQIERLANQRFLFSYPIIRLFKDPAQKELWEKRNLETKLSYFIDRLVTPSEIAQWVRAPLGGFVTRHSFLLHTERFLRYWRLFLRYHNFLIEAKFSEDQLTILSNGVEWNAQIRAKAAVYCLGDGMLLSDRWKSLLPFQVAKGESLTFESEHLPEQVIFNRGIHWAPLGNHLFRFGATYQWDERSPLPTASAYRELQQALLDFAIVPTTSIAQHAGIRITFPDHRPAIGQHPKFSPLWLFAGLGTKGVGYAPFLGYLLSRSLLYNDPIPGDIDLSRFS